MAIIAPLSRYKKKNMLIMMAILFGLGIWCIYDGYYNQKFIQEHVDENGAPQGWLAFNKKAPPFLIAGGLLYTVYFFMVRDKKVVADEEGFKAGKTNVPYDAIEKINKRISTARDILSSPIKTAAGKAKMLRSVTVTTITCRPFWIILLRKSVNCTEPYNFFNKEKNTNEFMCRWFAVGR